MQNLEKISKKEKNKFFLTLGTVYAKQFLHADEAQKIKIKNDIATHDSDFNFTMLDSIDSDFFTSDISISDQIANFGLADKIAKVKEGDDSFIFNNVKNKMSE